MSVAGLGCAKTPALALHVETSRSNCISESQIILHTPGSMPCWRIVFSTFRGCMSFYTARVKSGGDDRDRPASHVRFAPESGQAGRCLAESALCQEETCAPRAKRARCATALDMDVWWICWQDSWLERKDTRQCLATSGFLCSEHFCSRPQLERNRGRLTKRA